MKWLALTLALVAVGCSDPANTQYLPVGSRCSSSSQCGTSPFTCRTDYPGGYCEKPCTTDGDCPGDSLCNTAKMACRRVCSAAMDCRAPGYACEPFAMKGICEAAAVVDGGSP